MDHQQMVDEYRTSAQSFDWPDSYPAPNEPAGENPEVMFEVGFGNTLASLDYQCSWEKEWLETYSTDPARAEAALQKLEKVPSMDFMSHEVTDDATREIFADYLNRAKLGDPSGFQEDVELNCP